jgi:hypothetical protein
MDASLLLVCAVLCVASGAEALWPPRALPPPAQRSGLDPYACLSSGGFTGSPQAFTWCAFRRAE